MSSLTIHNLDEGLERKLRRRAAERNRAVEDEARDILHCALSAEPDLTSNLADRIRRRIDALGGIELELPPRGPLHEPPDLS